MKIDFKLLTIHNFAYDIYATLLHNNDHYKKNYTSNPWMKSV